MLQDTNEYYLDLSHSFD